MGIRNKLLGGTNIDDEWITYYDLNDTFDKIVDIVDNGR